MFKIAACIGRRPERALADRGAPRPMASGGRTTARHESPAASLRQRTRGACPSILGTASVSFGLAIAAVLAFGAGTAMARGGWAARSPLARGGTYGRVIGYRGGWRYGRGTRGFERSWWGPHWTGGFRYPSPLQRSVFPAYGYTYDYGLDYGYHYQTIGVAEPSFAVAVQAPREQWQPRRPASGSRDRRRRNRPRAMSIRVGGAPFTGGYFYPAGGFRHPSPLQRSVFPPDACYGIYRADVAAGGAYALNMNLPPPGPDTRVYLADRWPMATGVNLHRLPLVGNGPLARGLYRWRFGIAPDSYGSLVYVLVVAPWLCGQVPPYYGVSLDPWSNGGYGAGAAQPVLQADGPGRMVLMNRPAGNASAAPRAHMAAMPLPGDLLRNAQFSRGMLDWVSIPAEKHRDSVAFARVSDHGLQLSGTRAAGVHGVRQPVNADVGKASALILQARFKITRVSPRDAALTIVVCYRDGAGKHHCGATALRREYAALPAGTAVPPGVQAVPAGSWYQAMFDMMNLRPRPAHITSVTLLVPATPGQQVLVRDVHLLLRH